MSSLVHGNSNFRSELGRGLVGGIIVCAIIGGLFFLPEIISIFAPEEQKVVSNEKNKFVKKRSKKTAQAVATATPMKDLKKNKDSLDNLLSPLGKDVAPVIDAPEKGVAAAPREVVVPVSNTAAVTAEGCDVDLEKKEEKRLIPLEGPLEWKTLETDEIKKLLKVTDENSRKLFAALDPGRYRTSRYELAAFIAAIRTLRQGADNGLMSAEEALMKADYTDTQVSTALRNERAERDLKMMWKEISLVPILRAPLSARIKQKLVDPYDPRLTLVDVEVRHERVRDDRLFQSAPVRITVRGYVIGKDTEYVEYYVAGRKWESHRLQLREPDLQGRRYFEIREIRDADGKSVTLSAVSDEKKVFEKKYNFFPRIRIFPPFKRNDGYFMYRIPFKPFDPRLDRAFLVKQARLDPSRIQQPATQFASGKDFPMVAF